ncbi:unnamed protein product, partial [Tenebrio molitor]
FHGYLFEESYIYLFQRDKNLQPLISFLIPSAFICHSIIQCDLLKIRARPKTLPL